jgi:hypothetical protein
MLMGVLETGSQRISGFHFAKRAAERRRKGVTPPIMRHPSIQSRSTFSGWVGVARVDITPPIGIYTREWAAATHSVAQSIHRPLFLTALTFQAKRGAQPLVFVEADLGFWRNRELSESVRSKIRGECSLPLSRFLFGLSHTHSSVSLAEPDDGLPGGTLLRDYIERIQSASHEAVQAALENAEEAWLDWHYGRCALARNRDLPEPVPGSTRYVCGYNPDVVADDTLLVGRVTSRIGKRLATLVNYACHPTTLAWDNTAISPDFVGAMRDTIEDAAGGTAFFIQGASGELSPRHQYVGDPQVADRHGRHLGYACLATLEDMDPPGKALAFDRVVESGAPLAVWSLEEVPSSSVLEAIEVTATLPVKDWPSADELERQRLATTDRALQERLRRQRDTRLSLGDGDTYSISLWVWRIGSAVVVGVPGEPYSLLQRELRQRFRQMPVVCANLVNSAVSSYLPPQELYEQDIYQVWRTPFARGSLEIAIDALSGAIEQIMADGTTKAVIH